MSKPNNIYYEKPKHMQNSSFSNAENKEKAIGGYVSEEEYFAPSYQQENYKSEVHNRKQSVSAVKAWIANGVLIVLSVIFALLFFIAAKEVRSYNYRWVRTADDFWYYIKEEQYSDVLTFYYSNQYNEVPLTPELEECYSVAEYFEAASLYKVAAHAGNQEDMEKYAAIMENNLRNMDGFLYVAEDINEKLGIE